MTKFAIEVDEFYHEDRHINYEIQRQKALEKDLDFEFIRIILDEIHRRIKK